MIKDWDDFWLREVHPHGLAFTRICLGLFLLVYLGLYIPNITVMFSNEGLVLPLYLEKFPALEIFLAPQSPLVAHIIYGVFMLALVGITLGAFFRISALISILMGLYIWQLQLHIFPTSYNRILFFTLLVILFSGAHKTWSFDQWRRTGSAYSWEKICILPQRLLTMQITATFLGVSIQKFWLPHWQGGEVLAYSFISRWGSFLAHWYVNLPFTIIHYDIVVWIVKITQPIAAVGMWIPRTRFWSWVYLSGFLLFVSTFLSIWWFVFIIPASILYWDQEDVFTWCRKHAGGRIPKSASKSTK